MPRLSNVGIGIQGARAFKNSVLDYFRRTKDYELKMTVPLIGSHRAPRKNLDSCASICDLEFSREIQKMSDAFLATHPDGIFQAYRFRKPPHVNSNRRTNPRRERSTRTTTSTQLYEGGPLVNDGDADGTLFEVDGTTYCLFRMYETVAHQGGNCMACAYVSSPSKPIVN